MKRILFIMFTTLLLSSCLTIAGLYSVDSSIEANNPSLGGLDGQTYLIVIQCDEEDAIVLLNGDIYGTTDKNGYWRTKVRSGIYQIKVLKKDFSSYDTNIKLDKNTTVRFKFKK